MSCYVNITQSITNKKDMKSKHFMNQEYIHVSILLDSVTILHSSAQNLQFPINYMLY